MFIFLFVFSTFAEDISIKFQKQKWQILFQSIQSKFQINNVDQYQWIFDDQKILYQQNDNQYYVDVPVDTDYLQIDDFSDSKQLIELVEFSVQDQKQGSITTSQTQIIQCEDIDQFLQIDQQSLIQIDFTEVLKNYQNQSFVVEINFFVHIYGDWSEDDYVVFSQEKDLIQFWNFRTCNQQIHQQSCVDKKLQLCQLNSPIMINQQLFVEFEVSKNSELKFDDLKFQLKIENKEQESHAKIGLNFYQVYFKKIIVQIIYDKINQLFF